LFLVLFVDVMLSYGLLSELKKSTRMKKYNQEELNYFGLSQQDLTPGDLYEQNIDQEYQVGKSNAGDPSDRHKPRSDKRKFEQAQQDNTTDISPDKGEIKCDEGIQTIEQNYGTINVGDLLQSKADLWYNGMLVPKDAIFTVVSRPKKIKKVKKDIEDAPTFDFIVEAKTLLDTGQVIAIRSNMRNLKKLDDNSIKVLDSDLKW
jgi:hypothetical protein